ncbi:MAG TPA: hypothetical protein VNW97_07510 [Candidatus Saccharimonadales bacterium]|jgi:hypothetical protein|nr:hypothetical protein [Candidatus Saccharimonadales bacterium]
MTAVLWLFAGGAAAQLAERLLKRLTRLTDQYPEDVYMFLQPLNWEVFKRDRAFDHREFDRNYGKHWLWSGRFAERHRRRELRSWIALDREYLGRMDHNVALLELSAANDWKLTRRCRKDRTAERLRCLEAVAAMEKAATELEQEAELPENHGQTEGLRHDAAQIRVGSRDLLSEDAECNRERETHDRRIIEARRAFLEFRSAAGWQLAKLDCLSLLLRLDWLMLLPVRPVAALWRSGSSELVRLYRRAKDKAVAHAMLYENDGEVSKHM